MAIMYLAFYHISIYDSNMTHLSKRELDYKVEKQIYDMLEFVLGAMNKNEIKRFLSSLLSDTEKTMLSKRLAAAIMLKEGISYEDISDTLKITPTTVYRTHLLVQIKPEGFNIAAKKIEVDKMLKEIKNGLLKFAGYAIRAAGGKVKPEIF